MGTTKLIKLRNKIVKIDSQIIKSIAERFNVTCKIQSEKKLLDIPKEQKKREKMLINKYLDLADAYNIPHTVIKKIFMPLFSFAKKYDNLYRNKK